MSAIDWICKKISLESASGQLSGITISGQQVLPSKLDACTKVTTCCSYSIGTISLLRLARSLLTLIVSCTICYVFKIKAGRLERIMVLAIALLVNNLFEFACLRKRLFTFITTAFITNVDELQALLDACSSTQEWV